MTSERATPAPTVVELTVDGARYQVSVPDAATDYIQGGLVRTATPYEHEMLRDMASRLAAGDVVVDVGANIGNHALYLAAVTGCDVVAYEPNDRLTTPLRRSVEVNGLSDRVRVRPVAVGERSGRASFAREMPTNLGGQSVEADCAGPLEVVRLDDEDLPPVAMVKIDVEGMELEVLAGAARLIEEHRPLVYVECRTRDDLIRIDRWAVAHRYVLCDEFNATPTFRLEPAERLSEAERLDRAIARGLRERFEVSERLAETRAGLEEVNRKYRSQVVAAKALQTALDEAQTRIESGAQERVAVDRAIEEMRAEREQLVATIAALEEERDAGAARAAADLAEHRRALHALRAERSAVSDRLRRAEAEAREHRSALARSESARRELMARLHELAAEVAAVRADHERTREELAVSQADVERTAAELEEAQADLVRARAERTTAVSALRSQVAELQTEVTGLREQVVRWQSQAADRERAQRDERRAAQEVEVLNRVLREERDRLAADLSAARSDADDQRRRVADLRASLTFRTGKAIRTARSSFPDALRLPLTLARLSRGTTAGPRGRVLEIAAPTSPAASPSAEEQTRPVREPVAAGAVDRSRGTRPRVAAIMDEFTRLSFAPEWDLTDLTPGAWEHELAECGPDLLFVESAWRGRDGSWHNMVDRAGDELRGIVAWCRERGVPTVFWNKEDPVHYATFLNAAGLFDHVFTTDIDRIEHYKAALRHDRVWLLPFAVQPAAYHPIAGEDRRDAFLFAGAYYRRYPERTRDLESYMEHLPQLRPVDIYDRNLGGTDEAYMFPDSYRGSIVGTLAPEEVPDAYRRYRYAINLNSVKQSQTMLARRIFELLASGTLTVSNDARAARVLFGDLVVTTDSGPEAVRRLREIEATGTSDDIRLGALRTVMRQHTYADRASYVLSRVLGRPWTPWAPAVHVVAHATTASELARLVEHLERQRYDRWTATVAVGAGVDGPEGLDSRIALLPLDRVPRTLGEAAAGAEVIAPMWAPDYYGADYLTDLVLGFRYTAASAVGKHRHHRWENGAAGLTDGVEYQAVQDLGARRSLVRAQAVASTTTADLLALLVADGPVPVAHQVALDRFSYCAAPADDHVAARSVDPRPPASGTGMDELIRAAEAIPPAAVADTVDEMTGQDLADAFAGATRRGIDLDLSASGVRVSAALADDVHDYVYAPRTIPVPASWSDVGAVHVDAGIGLDLQVALVCYDEGGTRLGSTVVRSHTNTTIDVPDGTAQVKLGLRVRGTGSAELRTIAWSHRVTEPTTVVPRASALVVTNIYPSYGDLYRNGFVHSRVRAYRDRGLACEVFCLRDESAIAYREFEGVDVTTGSGRALAGLVRDGGHEAVLVHFLDPLMWDALQARRPGTRVVVWIHGAEVQPWWRRSYNITDEEQLAVEKERSTRRLEFWRSVFADPGDDVHFVFVSRYFADEVMQDVGVELPAHRYSIIHNPIDTELFSYRPKDVELRRKVLSVRPYASRKYANDLAVDAVLALRDEPEFSAMTFRFVGDGPLFDETLAPLRDMPNVTLERRFLTQHEIVELHRQHGVFLVPTRMDAQGVSRDEAMASGLVPVTNAVAAVPEFVDEESGVLAPGDDHAVMAAGMLELVRDPERFSRMSAAAAARVERQSSARSVITAEIELIRSRGESS
ncbi:FkbM family methyltransferase [Cellulomonas iranensis]|uniref:FkbM family methyltransferase n=1 Tax=Cellulomonas iranensis TaxID=76862 RepID=UPI003D7E93AA